MTSMVKFKYFIDKLNIMKVAVIPDSAMIVIPLIEKNGHEYISATGFSKYNDYSDDNLDKSKLPFTLNTNKIINENKYGLNELPSGVKGQLAVFYPLFQRAEAFIVIHNDKSKNREKMYDGLNELILFGSTGCSNERKIVLNMIDQKDCPVLKLSHPNNREEIIKLISDTNNFLKNLDRYKGKNVIFDKTKSEENKIAVFEFEKILNDMHLQ